MNAISNSLIHFDIFNFLKFKKKHRNTKLGCYINFSRFLAINRLIFHLFIQSELISRKKKLAR